MLKCKTLCFAEGSIIADSQEKATGLMVITAGQVQLVDLQSCKELYMQTKEILISMIIPKHFIAANHLTANNRHGESVLLPGWSRAANGL